MSQNMTQVLIIVLPILCITAWYLNWYAKYKLKQSGQLEAARRRKMHNKFVRYNTNVFTRKTFRKIVENYATFECFTDVEMHSKTVKLFENALLKSLIFPVVALVLTREVLFCLLSILMSYVFFNVTINKGIDEIYSQAAEDLSTCVQSIRERYLETNNIATSVLQADKGVYLEKPISRIYDILVDSEGKDKLLDFIRESPIRKIKTLAMICYIKNEWGDTLTSTGLAFANDLITLRQEIDSEIRRLKQSRIAFKSMSTIALVSLAVAPICELFLLYSIPGTSTMLKNTYGSIVNCGIIIITTVCYNIINSFMRPSAVNSVDVNETILKLTRNREVQKFLERLRPKDYKTKAKLKAIMDDSLTSKTVDYIYMSKVIYSVAGFIIGFACMCIFSITNKEYLLNNYNSLQFGTIEYTERQLRQIKTVDEIFMAEEEKMLDDEIYDLVKARVQGYSDPEITTQVERLSKKWDMYHSLGFKWWFVLVGFVVAVVGWFLPEAGLILRKKLVSFEDDEDIMQLQNLMIVLSDTNMSVFQALYWLEKQSNMHKGALRYAYHEYISDPEGSLYRLKASSASVEMKRLISKLESAMYKLSLQDAFSDMRLNKENMLRLTEMLQEENLKMKINLAKTLSMIPMKASLYLCFVGPLLILGIGQLTGSMSGAGSLNAGGL